jgi:hypothetical protein
LGKGYWVWGKGFFLPLSPSPFPLNRAVLIQVLILALKTNTKSLRHLPKWMLLPLASIDLAIDWEHLHRISGNDEEFELNLLRVCVEDIKPRLEIIIAAIASDDFGQIAREAHYLKGASANVGATAKIPPPAATPLKRG